MEELLVFNNEEFGQVRSMTIDGEPWFVGKDVAERLGYQNSSKALTDHVDSDDKLNNVSLSSLGQRGGWLINESGVYSLVLSSKLPSAKKFKHWITSEVIPSIRKHQIYATPEMTEKIISDPDFGISILKALKTEREKVASLELKVSDQVKEIETLTPKASYYDHVLQSPDLVLITQIAKDYGMSGQQMNKLLHDLKIQYRKGNTWVLYQQYAPKGYAKTKTNLYPDERGKQHASLHTCWTQKGRLFIYDTLKANGILPLMEKE